MKLYSKLKKSFETFIGIDFIRSMRLEFFN